MKKIVKDFTEALTAIGCAFIIAGNRVEVTSGYVYLRSLTALPDNVTFSNGGHVYLRSLTALPDNVTFSNGGHVDLPSLTALPDNVTFSNGGHVYLPSLTALPDNVTFSNGGHVYLPSLPAGIYIYRSTTIRLETIDGYTMVIGSTRTMGDYSVSSARYFGGGDIKKLKRCYIARSGEYTAHGETAAEAMRDCRFKAMQAEFDSADLVEEIKRRGTVEFNDFRLLTGACSEGLRHGMEECGLDPASESLPLATVLAKAHGSFGASFKAMFA